MISLSYIPTTHYYIASGVEHLFEQCALLHYAGRQSTRQEQVFCFWGVKTEEETQRACWFSCSAPAQELIAAGNQVKAEADRIQSIRCWTDFSVANCSH